MNRHQLRETFTDAYQGVTVEATARLVKNVALVGTASKNGYGYSTESLTEAAALYEGKPVFLDHGSSPLSPRQRSARDLAGRVQNVRFESGRLRGDVHTLETEAGRTFLALAEANSPAVGMSHVVLAEKSADGKTVNKIHDVISVDAVAFPATTDSFQESEQLLQPALVEQLVAAIAARFPQLAAAPAQVTSERRNDPTPGSITDAAFAAALTARR